MAIVSGQPFLDLLRWHPRDVDTLLEHYQELEDQAAEARTEQMRAEVLKTMRG